jgi:hypothetical protein
VAGSILFLDLATKSGFADGEPGKKPYFGSMRFAPEGAGSGAIFGGCFKWIAERCQTFKPKTIVYEAPLDPRHVGPKTTRDTAMRLIGLPAVVEAAAYLCGVWDVREARADDVRLFLLGMRPKKDEAKRLVMAKLRALGYDVDGPDAADALAGWLYACSIIAPGVARDTTSLFGEIRTEAMKSGAPF